MTVAPPSDADEFPMPTSIGELPATYMRFLVVRWVIGPQVGLTMKEFYDRRADALKLLGAANATGMLSIGAFLTAGKAVAGTGAAKIAIALFTCGAGTFGIAYFVLYRWEYHIDQVLYCFQRSRSFVTDDLTRLAFDRATQNWLRLGRWTMTSLVCFVLGWLVTIAALFVVV